MESRVRRRVEAITGADCRDVRVHLDGDAHAAVAELGARACTVGRNIYFGAGEYRPHTTDGARLIAHELIHTIQQGATRRPQAKPRLGAAADAHEQEADTIAEAALASGARGPTHPVRTRVDGGTVVQRKVFVDGKRATFHPANPPSPDEYTLDGALEQVGAARNIGEMVADRRSRFFLDEAELRDYATEKTTDIGYVDREKTWVRLPNKPLVLGENHGGTTLRDLVEATRNPRYLYEGGRVAAVDGQHDVDRAIEPKLPMRTVGLVGVEVRLKRRIDEIKAKYVGCTGFDKSAWKAAHDQEKAAAPAVQPQAAYAGAFAEWNARWEDEHPNASSRFDHHYTSINSTVGTVEPEPPERDYDRAAQEAALTRRALAYLRDDAEVKTDALAKFYRDHKEILDTTLGELENGVALEHTRMFRKMVTGKFDFTKLRELMAAAAEAAFKADGVEDVSGMDGYVGNIETHELGRRMEVLRDSYMLDRIVKGVQAGVRLFGVGDLHRRNLVAPLQQKIADLEVMSSDTFYSRQYSKHRDRD